MKKEALMILENKYLTAGVARRKFEQEISFAWQAYNASPLLQKCTDESILASVYNVALVGLSLNPVLKHAALVPRWNTKDGKYECSLEPQYQGLINLAVKSGTIKAIVANVVYDGDDLDMDYSTLKKVTKHVPFIVTGRERGNLKAVYSIAVLSDGTELGEVMGRFEIEEIMKRSESYKAMQAGKIKTCIWASDFGEMAKKTVVKRQIKYLSKGENIQTDQLMQAVELDNQANGFRALVTLDQIEYLTHLIEEEIKVDDNTLNFLRIKMKNLEFKDEAGELIDHIFVNYVTDPPNLSQSRINKIVDEKVNQPNT